MLTSAAQLDTGITVVSAVGAYLSAHAAHAPGLNLSESPARITQLAPFSRLDVGILCSASTSVLSRRERCDHIWHAIARLNDKTDGWFDTLLPTTTVYAREVLVGCSSGHAPAGLALLRSSTDRSFTAVFSGCSGDVGAISAASAREV